MVHYRDRDTNLKFFKKHYDENHSINGIDKNNNEPIRDVFDVARDISILLVESVLRNGHAMVKSLEGSLNPIYSEKPPLYGNYSTQYETSSTISKKVGKITKKSLKSRRKKKKIL